MRKFNGLVFDEFIPANANPVDTYTSAGLNDRLGAFDKLSIMAVADNVTGSTPTLTVQIYQSCDQRNWKAKSGTAEINASSLASTPTVMVGSDTSAAGSLGFVRLNIVLSANVSAHVKIWITARDTVQ